MNATAKPTIQRVAARIDRDQSGAVLVKGQDQDLFVLTMTEAANVLERHQRRKEEAMDIVRRFSTIISDWCNPLQQKLRLACLSIRETGWVVWVVSQSPTYDEALSAPLHTLRLALDDAFPDLPMEVRQLPNGSPHALADFIEFDRSVLIHGEPPPTPASS